MKKLTKKSLDELAKTLPVIQKTEQLQCVGGGNGTVGNPYTVSEYNAMADNGTWTGGYVEGWGYTLESVTCISSYNRKPEDPTPTGIYNWDHMYRSGYQAGFNAGISGGSIDDVGVAIWGFVSGAISRDPNTGESDESMSWYSRGIFEGLKAGRAAKQSQQ